jgi:hypothetical protein
MRVIVPCVIALFGASLVACSSGVHVSSSATGSVLGPVHPVSESTESTAKPTAQAAWCNIGLGTQLVDVYYAMGQPDEYTLAANNPLLQPGQETAEWHDGSDIFLATFTAGKASSLQAYDKVVGPAGAKDLSCEPFRRGNS